MIPTRLAAPAAARETSGHLVLETPAAGAGVGRGPVAGEQSLFAPGMVDLHLALDHGHPGAPGAAADGEDRAFDRDQEVVGRNVEPALTLRSGFHYHVAPLHSYGRPLAGFDGQLGAAAHLDS